MKDLAQIKTRIIDSMIQFVTDYHKSFGPVPLQALSIRFARRLKRFGGFDEVMTDLRADGTLQAVMKESGAYLYFPAEVTVELADGQMLIERKAA